MNTCEKRMGTKAGPPVASVTGQRAPGERGTGTNMVSKSCLEELKINAPAGSGPGHTGTQHWYRRSKLQPSIKYPGHPQAALVFFFPTYTHTLSLSPSPGCLPPLTMQALLSQVQSKKDFDPFKIKASQTPSSQEIHFCRREASVSHY